MKKKTDEVLDRVFISNDANLICKVHNNFYLGRVFVFNNIERWTFMLVGKAQNLDLKNSKGITILRADSNRNSILKQFDEVTKKRGNCKELTYVFCDVKIAGTKRIKGVEDSDNLFRGLLKKGIDKNNILLYTTNLLTNEGKRKLEREYSRDFGADNNILDIKQLDLCLQQMQ